MQGVRAEMISDRTEELIEAFSTCNWFQNVGTPPGHDTVEQVHGWKQAITMFHSLDWENNCLEARNGLTMRLDRDFRDRLQSWNEQIKAIDRRLIPIIDPVAIRTVEEHPECDELRDTFKIFWERNPKPHESLKFRHTLLSTVSMACMEAEYSDVIPLAFFSEMSAWYLAGHLPCGLTDEYPNGKLIIF